MSEHTHDEAGVSEREGLRHRHKYGLVPVWLADGSAVDSWWWCTDHPAGEWVKIEDDPDAAVSIPGWLASEATGVAEGAGLDPERLWTEFLAGDIDLDIAVERRRQDDKWGQQNHDATVWLAVLTEEVGELAEAVLVRRALLADGYSIGPAVEAMRHEAIQVAAVAVAFIEWMDRGAPVHANAAAETASVELTHHGLATPAPEEQL